MSKRVLLNGVTHISQPNGILTLCSLPIDSAKQAIGPCTCEKCKKREQEKQS